jgi:hypothetical protein
MVWTLRVGAHLVKRGIQRTSIGRVLDNVQVSGDCPQYLDAIQMHPVSLGGAAQIEGVGGRHIRPSSRDTTNKSTIIRLSFTYLVNKKHRNEVFSVRITSTNSNWGRCN